MHEILKVSEENLVDQFSRLNLNTKLEVLFDKFEITRELFAASIEQRNDPFNQIKVSLASWKFLVDFHEIFS
jgi:hypothetical protein